MTSPRRAAMTITTYPDSCAPAEEAISVYEAIGGRAAVVAAVEGLCGRLLADPALSPFFPAGFGPRHRAYLVTVLGEALGGPERYRGRSIADAQFDRTAAHLSATLDELGVPGHLGERIVGIVAGLRPAVVTA